MARKTTIILTAGVLLAGCLAGCGVRGPLQNPRADGSSSAAPTPEETANADSGQGKPANAAQKPHQGFILDGLLR